MDATISTISTIATIAKRIVREYHYRREEGYDEDEMVRQVAETLKSVAPADIQEYQDLCSLGDGYDARYERFDWWEKHRDDAIRMSEDAVRERELEKKRGGAALSHPFYPYKGQLERNRIYIESTLHMIAHQRKSEKDTRDLDLKYAEEFVLAVPATAVAALHSFCPAPKLADIYDAYVKERRIITRPYEEWESDSMAKRLSAGALIMRAEKLGITGRGVHRLLSGGSFNYLANSDDDAFRNEIVSQVRMRKNGTGDYEVHVREPKGVLQTVVEGFKRRLLSGQYPGTVNPSHDGSRVGSGAHVGEAAKALRERYGVGGR